MIFWYQSDIFCMRKVILTITQWGTNLWRNDGHWREMFVGKTSFGLGAQV